MGGSMNERIKELANIWANLRAKDDRLGITYTFSEKALEQLAELIVQECASICELNGQSYKYSFTPAKAQLAESTSNHCGLMIKKHFGVEE